MKRLCSLLFVLLFIITGCGTETKQQNKMPKVLPEDFDFMVSFGYGEVTKNEINTYQDTVVKDLIMNGTTTANITFTMEEMRSIYEKMREINIMGTKVLLPTNQNCSQKPYNKDSWKISVDGETKNFTWSDKNCDVTSDAQQLLELRTFIQNIVAGKDAYKELPQAEGGYD
ncbi:hypothetical protein [Paenibacillus sp. IHBB 10380]|uniref:hypothetical protein n=1 Tax=Paenibacillus sp. IHBB 10380 TaxID=1566358 RepID=UPI0005CF953E|nr:hypothetical protein [Paenibacillus sp. IHBB 10380]AJS58615.1 hypothetical protein UB51_09080 [Paenibacillus sp. IHBB 10380]